MSSNGSGNKPSSPKTANRARRLLAGAALALGLSLPAAPPAHAPEPTPKPAGRFSLRFPRLECYQLESAAPPGAQWLRARAENHPEASIEFGSRVVLQVAPGTDPTRLLGTSALRLDRRISQDLFVLQAPDALTALTEAAALSNQPAVVSCRPVLRRPFAKHGPYARLPDDPRFPALWHLENRAPDGARFGPDLNARAAWPYSLGTGVTVAVVDDGVELGHPDLDPATSNAWHFDFTTGTTGGGPTSGFDTHATEVAGFIAARDNNRRGVAGLAPRASLVSWKIFNGAFLPLSDEELMDVYRFRSQEVAVQNHSWGNAGPEPLGLTSLELAGLAEAFEQGRHGLGVVMVRAGGNGRDQLHNANDDDAANDPRVIDVGAVDSNGRVTVYSNPGACLLVSGFGGSTNGLALTTTDRVGFEGDSTGPGDDADYVTGIAGTSFAAPQISALAALLLSANPALSYRDIQHLLILTSRSLDAADPDLTTNRAGFVHSHNTGFGVPDAGQAMPYAQSWTTRPPLIERRFATQSPAAIPDDGLRVIVTADELTPALASIPSTPGLGAQADDPTLPLTLVDVGVATNDLAIDLHGKAALIQRGPPVAFPDERTTFRRKLERAAAAGAALALVTNDRDLNVRPVMQDTDFIPIPAVFLSQTDGEALRNQLTADPSTRVQLQRTGPNLTFTVPDTLACEHVGLRITTSHPRRGDLRIVIRSPHGTRSTLQRLNFDFNPGPQNWTFWSTRHFGEPSAGTWTVEVTDQAPGNVGTITQLELILQGVPITDGDGDGLDDAWEQDWFGGLDPDPGDDPDGDRLSNVREAWLHTDPTRSNRDPRAWFNILNATQGRLSWDASPGRLYEIRSGSALPDPFPPYTERLATEPEMEIILPLAPTTSRYFQVREVP